MAGKHELVDKVKREIGVWSWYPGGTFNTGYEGRWARSRESVSRLDFEEAFDEIKAYVESAGYPCSIRRAPAGVGEWTISVAIGARPAFAFHVRVEE